MNENKNKEYAESIRKIADFYEANPTLPIPNTSFTIYDTEEMGFSGIAKILKTFEKRYNDEFISISKKFGEIELRVVEYREKVCKKVLVGKKMVKKEIVIEKKIEEVEEDVFEWQCEDASLLKGATE